MGRFVGPWDSHFHVRPELTDEEKLDILNSGKKLIIKRNMYSNKKRDELIQQGLIVDLPLAPKRNNSKQFKLTTAQRETMKEIYGIQTDVNTTERDVLKILRKRYKHHQFLKV